MSPEQLAKLMDGPAAKPPPGVIPNFDNPPNSNQKITILCILAAVIGTPFVIMRLYTRIVLLRKIMFEDFCILVGAILAGCGLNVVVMETRPLHYGAHQWNIRYRDLITYLKLAHTATLLFNVIMLLLRLAIIVQIKRAFVTPRSRNFTFWASWVLIVANVCFWATITMLEIFSCSPREKLWNPVIEGKCIDRHAYQIASAVMNMASEMFIILLPQRVIWTLSLTTKQRLGLSMLFALGIITIASSTLRLAYTIKMWPTTDITYFISDGVTLWTIPEVTCSIVVPCITVLPQFIRIIRGKVQARRRPSTYMFSGQKAPGGRRGNSKQSEHFVIRKTTEFLVSDIEYHELVMRPNTTTHSEEGEIAPWVQQPSEARVRPGRPEHNAIHDDDRPKRQRFKRRQ